MGTELLALLMSTGGAAMIWTIFQAWRSVRAGAVADERDQIELSEERRRSAEIDRDSAIAVANYWRARAGVLEYLLVKGQGAEAVPTFPPEPRMTFTPVNIPDTTVVPMPHLEGMPKVDGS